MPIETEDIHYRESRNRNADVSDRLYVPETRDVRDRLRARVAAFVSERELTPPLSLAEFEDHSEEIIERNGLHPRVEDILKILINNEAWRAAVAAVPFERRTLLLPPCLRSATMCRAEFDELGLLCEQCGNCLLGELVGEAEALGYAVLIAEGTSIVASLVKKGMIDAVLGVSCMHSLERTYPHVYANAIPGLAIPLLQDGCSDTRVDGDWIREAIHLRSDQTESRLDDLGTMHDEISSWFEEKQLRAALALSGSETEEISIAWLAQAGKRWRPFLAVSVYEALAGKRGEPLPDKVRSVAIAVECIHKASLVYDDIQDGDECRYGEETLYKKHGVPVALTASLFLLGQGYKLLSSCAASAEERTEMLALATGGHCELCLGQGRELCWARSPEPLTPDEVLEIFRAKTAPSFEVVFGLGAICAGANAEIHRILKAYSLDLGVAYQVQDDLDDFDGEGDVDDILSGRPSIILALAYERAGADRKQHVADVWCGASDRAGADSVREIINQTGSAERAREILLDYKRRALNALRPLKNRDLKIILYRLAGRILNVAESRT